MKIETDYEILTNLINQLIKTDNNNHRKIILTDLEFYLHQVCSNLNIFLFLISSIILV